MSSASWEGRSRGNKLGYSIFIGLIKNFGLRPAYGLLRFVALYYRFFVPAATRPLRYLYEQRMGFSRKQANKLIRQNILYFGQGIIDKVAMVSKIKTDLEFTHGRLANFEEMIAAGEGGIVVSAHLGNWEVAGHMLGPVGATVNILMYDGEEAQIKQFMEQYDNKRSFNVIVVKPDNSHVYEINAALRRNELVCIHADRFRPGNRTFVRKFLGEEAHFPAGPFILASKLKARALFTFTFKVSDTHYRYVSYPSRIYEGRGTTGAEAMLDDFILHLEEQVRLYPDQWFNYYDFWKATP